MFALLVNPPTPYTETEVRAAGDAARALGLQLHVLQAAATGEIDSAFAAVGGLRPGALIVGADPFLTDQRAQIVALAARHASDLWRPVGFSLTSGVCQTCE